MEYISTRTSGQSVRLYQAVTSCLAPDGGMYMPARTPVIPKAFFKNIGSMGLKEIAYVVASAFFAEDIPAEVLKGMVDYSFSTPIQMQQLTDDMYVLELFHGPTLTFKDYGARFLAKMLQYFDRNSSVPRHVLIATTGNTGAAAAAGLYKMPNVTVSVLYPKGRLNSMQKNELISLGENIYPIEVAGTIEDCKTLIQTAMVDESLKHLNLTGANSINVARLLPQVTFALYAYSRLISAGHHGADKAIFSIPSGNMSNVVATAISAHMGMPMSRILATPGQGMRPNTLTPSIDMSVPSGRARLDKLYESSPDFLQEQVQICRPVEDTEIVELINSMRFDYSYTIDPHGAAAAISAVKYQQSGCPLIIYATGHPAKQLDVMTRITGGSLEMPHQVNKWMTGRRQPVIIPPTIPALRKHISSIK